MRRLVARRGLTEGDARARTARQADRDARLAVADFVICNDGTLEELESQIGRLLPLGHLPRLTRPYSRTRPHHEPLAMKLSDTSDHSGRWGARRLDLDLAGTASEQRFLPSEA